jgi:tRNA pseudouridine38-40 synthase
MNEEGNQGAARRLRLDLAYCGTPWRGWQRQGCGGSVQEQVETAVRRLSGRQLAVKGASRTDAGVHALGQVAHVDAPADCRIPAASWRSGLNSILPAAIRVLDVAPAPDGFDACGSVSRKTYLYRLRTEGPADPFEADRLWHVPWALDFEKMREAAALLEGRHHFGRLSASGGERPSVERREDVEGCTRLMERIAVTRSGGIWEIRLTASGFLYHMARMIVAALVDVARGREDLRWLRDLVENPLTGPAAHHCAPPGGLYLESVDYAENENQ